MSGSVSESVYPPMHPKEGDLWNQTVSGHGKIYQVYSAGSWRIWKVTGMGRGDFQEELPDVQNLDTAKRPEDLEFNRQLAGYVEVIGEYENLLRELDRFVQTLEQ